MTAINGKPQGYWAQGAATTTKTVTTGGANAPVTKRQPPETRHAGDALTKRTRTEDQALRAIGEVNRFEKVDRAANARQDEDRRKLTTAELMRGQNTIRI